MRLRDLYVERYGPLPRFTHDCADGVEVFYGPNESGKTLLLEATLRLLSPGIDAAIPAVSRVDERPSGHVVLEVDGDEHRLGDGLHLPDVSELTARHLRNVFVIRDSDLRLADEHAFYDSVTQQIGDLHTAEIEAIQERFVEKGRLTSVGGRGLSGAEYRDEAERERDAARRLAADVREYVERATEDDVAAAEREFVAVAADLRQCADELAIQEAAETLDTHETLTNRLASYEAATRELDDDSSRSTLDELAELARDIEAGREVLERLEANRTELREERDRLDSTRQAVDAELAPLERRAEDVDDVERALESFRAASDDATGADRGMRFARSLALVGIGLGGVTAALGRTRAGLLLVAIGALGAAWYARQHRTVTAAERERDRVLQRARDVGLDVAAIDEIGPAIRTYRDELERLRERSAELDRELAVKDRRLDDCDAALDSERDDLRENRRAKRERLRAADVADVDEYRAQVERREALERERAVAERSLADALGDPAADDPAGGGSAAEERAPEAKIEYWEAELEATVADVDEDATAAVYDPDRLAELEREHERLQERHRELDEQLDEHEEQLAAFAERARAISARPFLDERVTLSARSLEGLRELARDLDRLVDRIERDADVAREALDVFDEIEAAEEEKITDLFGPDSTATDVFGRLTDGRYDGVSYDPAAKQLRVRRDGREQLTPRELSHATTDQLYLATRVGLASRLLSAEPGFLLLDDPFLPADADRLANGFDLLRSLADDGWQILYFTAKDEVGAGMVDDRGLPCRELDPLG